MESQGQLDIALAESRMSALMKLREELVQQQPFKGISIGMALHVTKETAVLVKTLRDGGAHVFLTSCNPLSAQDEVIEALRSEKNISVFGKRGETKESYYANLHAVMKGISEAGKILLIDDGCDLISLLHQEYQSLTAKVLGACEETTTGVIRLRAMHADKALRIPVIAVNDNKTKHLMDNFYGTGQSTIDGILRSSGLLLAGKVFVVLGYGDCGKGVALRAKAMGAQVFVTEVDPFKALQAHYDGFQVVSLDEFLAQGDIFVTVTGCKHVIDEKHFQSLKDGAVLANAGHFNHEINVEALEKMASKKMRVRPYCDEYSLAEKKVFLLGEGRLVNLVCAEGHPSEVMSMSFCGQALACQYLVEHAEKLAAGVITLPSQIDGKIARLQLEALEITIDTLSAEQEMYLKSWQEGT